MWLFGLKVILKTYNENFQKVLVRISWTFACKSEMALWCTFDKEISKTFQYFKVWVKGGLNMTLLPKSDAKDLELKFPRSTR